MKLKVVYPPNISHHKTKNMGLDKIYGIKPEENNLFRFSPIGIFLSAIADLQLKCNHHSNGGATHLPIAIRVKTEKQMTGVKQISVTTCR